MGRKPWRSGAKQKQTRDSPKALSLSLQQDGVTLENRIKNILNHPRYPCQRGSVPRRFTAAYIALASLLQIPRTSRMLSAKANKLAGLS